MYLLKNPEELTNDQVRMGIFITFLILAMLTKIELQERKRKIKTLLSSWFISK